MTPAVSGPEQQQERDVKAHQDSERIMEVLSKVQALRARISQLGLSGDATRRCLAFMETELSIIAAFLTPTFSPQNWGVLEDYLGDVARLGLPVDRVLHEVDASRHAMLRRALQCFHRRKSYSYLPSCTVWFYHASDRYMHLLQTNSDLGPTPQLAEPEEGSLPLVGIDRPAKKILRWLAHHGNMDMILRVMSIVGPVGIGKTTLAVELRNRLRQHETSAGRCFFRCNVMAQASRGTDRNIRLLQDILSQVSPAATALLSSDPSQAKTMEFLVHLVAENLRNKRYFIIIDDIHKASDWEEIKGAFPADSSNLGSRILLTTRVTSIAEASYSSYFYSYDIVVHKVKPLNQIDSERLLLAKVVGCEDGCLPDNMKLFCDEILRRCDGTPLFIIGVADWLKEQLLQQVHQREDEVEEHQRFAMHFEEQVPRLPDRLEHALSSAFNDFPNGGLRSVLLYMSMFPYGYKFEKDRLILKWIYEGFTSYVLPTLSEVRYVLHSWNSSPARHSWRNFSEAKSKAEAFFSQLVDRNVITCVASNCKHKQEEAEACQWQVNHFLHQFLASKSAEMGFVFTTTTLNLVPTASTAKDRDSETSSRIPRRLALHHSDPLLPTLLETMDLSQTRSLAVSGAVNSGIIPLHRFVNLVMLDFAAWENLKDEDLLQVCRSKMFFLTYLSVRNTRVSMVPREIKEMHCLETLDVSYTQISEYPVEVFELTCLKHLDLRGTRITLLPKQIVGLPFNLEFLLVGGEGTINSVETAKRQPYEVRHLKHSRTQKITVLLETNIDKTVLFRLVYPRTPATVDLTTHPASFVRALGGLIMLRVLSVTWSFYQSTDRDYCEALLSSIGKWRHLQSLTIHCGLGCSMEFLGSLEESRAPRQLDKFKVTRGRFASVPPWIHCLTNLSLVEITVCNQLTTTDDLKILGALPRLRCLILSLDFIPGQAIVIQSQGFSELERFSVDCPTPWLTFRTGATPQLTQLQLKFSSGPASEDRVPSGITNLRRINEVDLKWCAKSANSTSVKMIVKAVREEVAKHRNPIDLFINGVEDDDVQAVDEEAENATGTSSRAADAEPRDDAQAVDEIEITEADS